MIASMAMGGQERRRRIAPPMFAIGTGLSGNPGVVPPYIRSAAKPD